MKAYAWEGEGAGLNQKMLTICIFIDLLPPWLYLRQKSEMTKFHRGHIETWQCTCKVHLPTCSSSLGMCELAYTCCALMQLESGFSKLSLQPQMDNFTMVKFTDFSMFSLIKFRFPEINRFSRSV